MPEGDVVWRAARQLQDALAGRVLTRTDFRVPRHATADLTGRRVIQACSRGKHLLIRVEGGVTIHSHLKMDGAWRIYPAGRRVPASHRIRVVLGNEACQAVGYQLGILELLPTAQEHRAVGHLGPDPLGPDWDPAEAARRLAAAPARPISEALLDQRNLAGVGNMYATEMLFLRGVSPWRPAGDAGDLEAMARLAQRLLAANRDRAGQVTTGSWRRGEENWVYGRAGRPCRRCGTQLRTAALGSQPQERVTFWCPRCQP